jgi:hypothetical protein
MLFVALFALALLMPQTRGWPAVALLTAFVLVMVELLRDLKEKT